MKIDSTQLKFILENTPAAQNIMLVGKHGIGKSRILEDFFAARGESAPAFTVDETAVLRGMDRDDAKKRMAMQMTREEYEELADRVLVNDGTIEELYEQIDRYVKEELNERGIRL